MRIEGPGDLGHRPLRIADEHVDAIGQAGAREVLSRRLRPRRVHLQGQQHPVGRKRGGQPDARIADGGADFEDALGADGGREDAQQRPDLGVDQGQVRRLAVALDGPEDRIGKLVEAGEVALDGVGNNLAHN